MDSSSYSRSTLNLMLWIFDAYSYTRLIRGRLADDFLFTDADLSVVTDRSGLFELRELRELSSSSMRPNSDPSHRNFQRLRLTEISLMTTKPRGAHLVGGVTRVFVTLEENVSSFYL